MKKRKFITFERRNARNGLLFVSPWILASTVMLLYPVINSILLSFSDPTVQGAFTIKLSGLENYKKAFFVDDFIPRFLYTIRYALSGLPMILIFSFFIAILLHRKMRFRGFFRSMFFLPVLIGTGVIMSRLLSKGVEVESMAMARKILMPDELMLYLGPEITKTVDGFLQWITIFLWKSGVQILLFLSGLQGISGALYESAHVDGATEWEKFWKITLPMMTPTILLVIIFTIVDSFNESYDRVLGYIIEVMMRRSDFKYAAAMGWIYFLFIILLVAIAFAITRPFIKKVTE